jgi:hypothetical protein
VCAAPGKALLGAGRKLATERTTQQTGAIGRLCEPGSPKLLKAPSMPKWKPMLFKPGGVPPVNSSRPQHSTARLPRSLLAHGPRLQDRIWLEGPVAQSRRGTAGLLFSCSAVPAPKAEARPRPKMLRIYTLAPPSEVLHLAQRALGTDSEANP